MLTLELFQIYPKQNYFRHNSTSKINSSTVTENSFTKGEEWLETHDPQVSLNTIDVFGEYSVTSGSHPHYISIKCYFDVFFFVVQAIYYKKLTTMRENLDSALPPPPPINNNLRPQVGFDLLFPDCQVCSFPDVFPWLRF